MRFLDATIINIGVDGKEDSSIFGTVTFIAKFPSQHTHRRDTNWAYFDRNHQSSLEKVIADNIPVNLLVYRYLRKYKFDGKEKSDFIDKIITITM